MVQLCHRRTLDEVDGVGAEFGRPPCVEDFLNVSTLPIWIEATRPKTLPAALCPVMVGSALAQAYGSFSGWPALLCLLFALLIQIGTNFANDYLDGIGGKDTAARLGPQRAVASGQIPAARMRAAALAVLGCAFILGLGLIPFGGWALLIVGLASVACAWLYTGGPYPLAYNGLGDVFVLLFFGFIAVGCTFYVQAKMLVPDVMLAGLACGLLINNILVVNNYRDREEDQGSGKRTLVVRFGPRFARVQYTVSLAVAAVTTSYFAFAGYGLEVLLALGVLVPGSLVAWRMGRLETAGDYLAALKQSGITVALYALVFSLTLVL